MDGLLAAAAVLVGASTVGSSWLCARRAALLLQHPFVPLPDVGHSVLPRAPRHLPDVLLAAAAVAVVHRYEQIGDLRPPAIVTLWCLAIRSVAVHFTLMPSPLPASTPWWFGTHDLMFSGHTVCFCAAATVLDAPWVAAVGGLSLIAARSHYTIDVAVAMVVYCVVAAAP